MDELTQLASAVKQRPTDESAVEAFRSELASITDARLLWAIAEHFEAELEVGVPIFQRLLALNDQDSAAMAALASLYAMHLQRDEAQHWAKEALKIDLRNTDAMYALLMSQEPDATNERERLCREILSIIPWTTVELELANILTATGRASEAKARLNVELDRLTHVQPESEQALAVTAALRALG